MAFFVSAGSLDIFWSVFAFFLFSSPDLSLPPSLSNSSDCKKFRQRVSRLWQKFMSMLRLSGIVQALYWNLSNVWPSHLNCSLICADAQCKFFFFLQPVAVSQTGPSVSGHGQAVVCRQKNEGQIMREKRADSEWCKWYRAKGLVQEGKLESKHVLVYVDVSQTEFLFSPLSVLSFFFFYFYSSFHLLFPNLFHLISPCSLLLCYITIVFFCFFLHRSETRLEQA